MTIFMVSHDIQESFSLGTRLLTFDKLRHDPQAPEAYGASVTYDMPLTRRTATGADGGRERLKTQIPGTSNWRQGPANG